MLVPIGKETNDDEEEELEELASTDDKEGELGGELSVVDEGELASADDEGELASVNDEGEELGGCWDFFWDLCCLLSCCCCNIIDGGLE